MICLDNSFGSRTDLARQGRNAQKPPDGFVSVRNMLLHWICHRTLAFLVLLLILREPHYGGRAIIVW